MTHPTRAPPENIRLPKAFRTVNNEPRPELTSAATRKGPLPRSAKLLTCRPHWSEQMATPPAKCSPPGCGKEHEARAGQQRSRAERTQTHGDSSFADSLNTLANTSHSLLNIRIWKFWS
ncbi:hypothetical protein JEQ12_013326 [Ovis aries]|uniref:Uncharacterized protein n=1 Tax=Ovis aries TaxID=9940 RepID=A0A836AHL7_SHEEP|nr:hypothetical protein JEQ12_013326 [Ovis aries]